MLEKVKEIVAEGLDVNAADLTEETTFESLGADSLDLMDMVMTFEDEFGVEIDTEAFFVVCVEPVVLPDVVPVLEV